MYPIRFIVVGKPKLKACRDLEEHYQTLLKGYARLDVCELSEGRGSLEQQLKDEAQRMRERLAGIRCPVLLDPDGPSHTSESFAKWLGTKMDRGESLGFVVGSSHGFDAAFKGEIRERLSLTPMTLPHDLCRVVFLEQLYRAMTILRGKTYHK